MSKRENRKQYYTEKEKEYIRDYNRYQELWDQRKEKEVWVELDKPVPNGYIRYFVLRNDISRSKKAKDIQYLLDTFLQNQWWCRTKKFPKKSDLRRRHGVGGWEWLQEEIKQEPELLSKEKWNKVPERFQRYFKKVELEKRPWDNVTVYAYKFKYRWMFSFKIEHDYYTHQRLPQGDVDSEMERLDDKLWHQGRGLRIVDNYCYTDPWKDVEQSNEKAAEKRQVKKEILEGLNENYFGHWARY